MILTTRIIFFLDCFNIAKETMFLCEVNSSRSIPHCSISSANTSNGGGPLFSYRKQKDEATTGDLPDAATYYPRFSG